MNNANSVTYSYDNDGLVTGVGSETIARSASTGQITGTTLGGVSTTRSYNGFGEPARDTATYSGSTIFDDVYDDGAINRRDKLGRIAHLSETIQGVTHSYDYAYDNRGRLFTVTIDGALTRTYTYDTNGNRLTKTQGGSMTTYVYDDQDRLLCERSTSGASCTWGGAGVSIVYSWSANGELASKHDATGLTNYSYDELGSLRSVSLPNGDTIDYLIDGESHRVSRRLRILRGWSDGKEEQFSERSA